MSDDGSDWGQHRADNEKLRDLPRPTEKGLGLLKQEQQRLRACLMPIERKAAALCLTKLRIRYAERSMPEEALKALIREDLDDIRQYPEQLVERACKIWRDDIKNNWAPKSVSHLMEPIKEEWGVMRKEIGRVSILIVNTEKDISLR